MHRRQPQRRRHATRRWASPQPPTRCPPTAARHLAGATTAGLYHHHHHRQFNRTRSSGGMHGGGGGGSWCLPRTPAAGKHTAATFAKREQRTNATPPNRVSTHHKVNQQCCGTAREHSPNQLPKEYEPHPMVMDKSLPVPTGMMPMATSCARPAFATSLTTQPTLPSPPHTTTRTAATAAAADGDGSGDDAGERVTRRITRSITLMHSARLVGVRGEKYTSRPRIACKPDTISRAWT